MRPGFCNTRVPAASLAMGLAYAVMATPGQAQVVSVPVPASGGTVAVQTVLNGTMIAESGGVMVVTGPVPATAPVASGAAARAAAGAAADAERRTRWVQMIQGLTFDRRPSAMLKAWRDPPPKLPEVVFPPVSALSVLNATLAAPTNTPAPTPPSVNAPSASAVPSAPASAPEAPATPEAASVAGAGAGASALAAVADVASGIVSALQPSNGSTAQSVGSPATAVATPVDPAAAAQAAQAAQAAEAEKLKAAEDALFRQRLTLFQRSVTLGEWDAVRRELETMELEVAVALYNQMLTSLQSGTTGQMNVDPNLLQQLVLEGASPTKIQQALSAVGQYPGAQYLEKNLFSMSDLEGLLTASPGDFEEAAYRNLGVMVRFSIDAGFDLDALLLSSPVTSARAGVRTVAVPPATSSATAASATAASPPVAAPASEKLPRTAHVLTARDVARVLSLAGQESRAADYLPSYEDAVAAQDAGGLNLMARSVLAKATDDQRTAALEEAWRATQAVLEIPLPPEPVPGATGADPNQAAQQQAALAGLPPGAVVSGMMVAGQAPGAVAAGAKHFEAARAARDEAMTRAVELAPKLRKEIGIEWLKHTFAQRAARGKEMLTAISAMTSTNLSAAPFNSELRLSALKLQKTAVDALLASGDGPLDEWREPLTIAAVAWLKEAQVSQEFDQSASQSSYQRDRYGNYYMFDYSSMYRGSMQQNVSAIRIDDMLELQPDARWLSYIRTDLPPKFSEILANLYLKLQDERAAFPYIEDLAKSHPERAKKLAEEFLRVWTTSHNPNEQRDGYNPFYYYWGYEQRAERIPLTRSKQERNLKELAEWIARLRKLPIGAIDETLLTSAFTAAHSKAEVYRLDTIESVFGSIEALKPRTIAELIQQMRGNLAGVWRMPDVQQQNSTKRKQRDIRAEVVHGYDMARSVTQNALQKYPDHWALLLAQASILHDQIDFEKEAEKSSDFSERRSEAMKLFAAAARAYVAQVDSLSVDEQNVLPFEMWFYASLGSVDLARITSDKASDPRQPKLIREAILSMPPEVSERHLAQFANNLFTRGSNAKPELKQKYFRAGFEVVGEHKLAREARKLVDYYSDLVHEIKLETRIDGSDVVGHERPFGVFVNLVHTKEIEREAGGFGKYLQNQNNPSMYFYNFGRPLVNYRDKFQEYVSKALADQFEVVSVTFQDASVNSRALPDYGWRMTPYAYLLLKAKGPQVDRIAPLQIDFDFLDTSGFAVLPVESPALVIDATADAPPARPVQGLVITQTLDERQADKGKLLLEVRATGVGLIPEIDQLLELTFPGFRVTSTDDRGLAVIEFDKESVENAVRSERQWTIALAADGDPEHMAKSFQFCAAKLPTKEQIYQRYEDADLIAVPATVSLEQTYTRVPWLWIGGAIAAGAFALTLLVWGLVRWMRQPKVVKAARYQLPETIDPFSVIGFLRDIEATSPLNEAGRKELRESIESIERHYFDAPIAPAPNLEQMAQRWLAAARTGKASR